MVVRGEHLNNGLSLPPVQAYVDDMTTITTTTKACTKHLLEKFQGNIKWARTEIKFNKFCGIFIVKSQLTDEMFRFYNEPAPIVLEKPIKSLG